MPGTMINIPTTDGNSFDGYLAIPDTGTGPGIIVLQEIFGVNYFMRETCHRLAAQGYLALCPDLFWRQKPNIELSDMTKGEWDKAFELYQGFDMEAGIIDSNSALEHLRSSDKCTGKIGAVGYCLGGMLSYMVAARTKVDASVGYYGVGIQESLDESPNIVNPHMMHLAQLDQFVPKDAQDLINNHFKENPIVTIHSYTNVDHAFARTGGEHYTEVAAQLANSRTAKFFEEHLL